MDTGRGVVANEGIESDCKSPVLFSAKAWIELSPWPTTYIKARVGAVELLLDPRQPLKSTIMNNNVMVKTAFIRCFLILRKIRTLTAAHNNVPELTLASCESV